MARYIDAEPLEKWINEFHPEDAYWSVSMLKNAPTADVAEVVYAKWEISSNGYYPYCTHCKTEPENGVMSKYCPECGAKMDITPPKGE